MANKMGALKGVSTGREKQAMTKQVDRIERRLKRRQNAKRVVLKREYM